jgi:DnaJ-class molecular chaperone
MMGEESDFERRFKNAVLLARFSNEASFVFLNDALNNEGYRQRAIRALEQYFKGEVKKIAAVKKILCPSCLGSRECSACKGAGTVGEAIMLPVTCQWCGGSGKCPTCNGEGRIQRMYYKYIYVPAAKGEVSVGMPQITPGE